LAAAIPTVPASPSVVVIGTPRPRCELTPSVNGTGVSPVGSPPVRSSVGQGHVLSGTVRSSRDCAPLAGATLVFWLAGPDGKYAPAYEATVLTDGNGAYRFESTYPGTYEGTRPHIHMFVSADGHYGIETVYHPAPNQTMGTYNIVLAVQ
jgi:protocatechuate 3,4-dioxygenase beta subunit